MDKIKTQNKQQRKKFKITSKTMTRALCLLLVAITVFSFIATALVSVQ